MQKRDVNKETEESMSRSRREDILDAQVLLEVRRPDLRALKALRLIFGVLPAVYIVWSIWTSTKPDGLVILFSGIYMVLFVVVIYAAINPNPLILTEKGITQKLVQSVYWQELEGYTWLPWTKNYFRLDFQPTGDASVFVQFNQFKGSYRGIHRSGKAEMEKIFQQKGLREIV